MKPISMVFWTRTSQALALAGSVAWVLIATAAPVAAASWLEKNFYLSGPRYDAVLPACDAASALGKIVGRFAVKESRFWNSSLTIQDISAVREVSFRPWMEGTVPRRFCTGKVLVSDGRWRTMHYSIIEDGGMIGASWGVDWCVVGLDRNWAYNPNCKMALP